MAKKWTKTKNLLSQVPENSLGSSGQDVSENSLVWWDPTLAFCPCREPKTFRDKEVLTNDQVKVLVKDENKSALRKVLARREDWQTGRECLPFDRYNPAFFAANVWYELHLELEGQNAIYCKDRAAKRALMLKHEKNEHKTSCPTWRAFFLVLIKKLSLLPCRIEKAPTEMNQ